jgi:hypothetical protein
MLVKVRLDFFAKKFARPGTDVMIFKKDFRQRIGIVDSKQR